MAVSEFVSLDLVMEPPGAEPSTGTSDGWQETQGSSKYKLDACSLPLGRQTYEACGCPEGAFADKMNNMPKCVALTTFKKIAREHTT
jgi:hypothetical protein